MKIIGVNGSPRKNWNTHTLLTQALEGARAAGAETALYNLYEINYKGCVSCLECKRKNGMSIGRCAMRDGLTALLDDIHSSGALLIGSPIYFGEVTGMTRAFLERLYFQYLSYDADRTPYFDRRIPTGFIYTMNAPGQVLEQIGYTDKFKSYEGLNERLIGPAHTFISTATLQTEDYSAYHMSMINESERKQRRKDVFPKDCQSAYQLGKELVSEATTMA